MKQSHDSLRDDFAVSSDALNLMVECALNHPAAFGARMTGAGFGGCAVALVDAARAADFDRDVSAAYQRATGRAPSIYVTVPTDGVRVMSCA
jgi:galactokinase